MLPTVTLTMRGPPAKPGRPTDTEVAAAAIAGTTVVRQRARIALANIAYSTSLHVWLFVWLMFAASFTRVSALHPGRRRPANLRQRRERGIRPTCILRRRPPLFRCSCQ
jgi:hypothetical protein